MSDLIKEGRWKLAGEFFERSRPVTSPDNGKAAYLFCSSMKEGDIMPGSHPHRLNRFERQLLNELKAKANETPIPIEGSSVTLKRTPYGFVLEYGFSYKPCCLPPNIEFGEPKRCFDNAYRAMLHSELVYCEGFALGQSGLPVEHAWLTDGTGRAIDVTWRERGRAYLGVPLQKLFVLETSIRRLPDKGFIEDWKNECPLLMDLGDRPNEWLESKGCGIRKLPR